MSHTPSPIGSLFVIAAPSGAGKSSLVKALLEKEPAMRLSISTTTRPPRPGEEHGREYFFSSKGDFLQRQVAGEFLEYAEVHGNFYGTSRLALEEQIQAGKDVLLEIDWQGAQQIRRYFPQTVSVFILPPSMAALEERLRKRGQDTEDVIQHRLAGASTELAHASEFEYVIINLDFAAALDQLLAIVRATRCKLQQQAARHSSLFAQLGIHSHQK